MISWTITDTHYSAYDVIRLKEAGSYTQPALKFLSFIINDAIEDLSYLYETCYIHAFYCECINGMKI